MKINAVKIGSLWMIWMWKKIYLFFVTVFDSFGRFPPPGFAEGIQSSFGDYDQCLEIKSPNFKDSKQFEGQYCLLKLILPFPTQESYKEGEPVHQEFELRSQSLRNFKLEKYISVKNFIETINRWNGTFYRFGICMPSVCSGREVENMVNKS
jgi:hypothetical protein